jgi:hypothetical protein
VDDIPGIFDGIKVVLPGFLTKLKKELPNKRLILSTFSF